MNEVTALRNCPFCGGRVTWCPCGRCAAIECSRCGSFNPFAPVAVAEATLGSRRLYAAEKWNTRVAEALH